MPHYQRQKPGTRKPNRTVNPQAVYTVYQAPQLQYQAPKLQHRPAPLVPGAVAHRLAKGKRRHRNDAVTQPVSLEHRSQLNSTADSARIRRRES